MINILTRTSNRPNYFKTCCDSIKLQTYKDINHIVGVDDIDSISYVEDYTTNYVYIDPIKYKHNQNKKFWYHEEGGEDSPAWWNAYFNDMYPLIKEGWVLFLDDDDQFLYENSLEYIINNISNIDELIFWKVQFPGYTIPRNKIEDLQSSPPQPCNISSIGFMFHSSYLNQAIWEPWGCGDFRVSHKLWGLIPNKITIPQILTGIQDIPHLGDRKDKR